MSGNDKHPVISVLEGKVVYPPPVMPLYPGVKWFGPGYYIRAHFFELLYQHVRKSGALEKEVSPEEILDLEVQATGEVFEDLEFYPADLVLPMT